MLLLHADCWILDAHLIQPSDVPKQQNKQQQTQPVGWTAFGVGFCGSVCPSQPWLWPRLRGIRSNISDFLSLSLPSPFLSRLRNLPAKIFVHTVQSKLACLIIRPWQTYVVFLFSDRFPSILLAKTFSKGPPLVYFHEFNFWLAIIKNFQKAPSAPLWLNLREREREREKGGGGERAPKNAGFWSNIFFLNCSKLHFGLFFFQKFWQKVSQYSNCGELDKGRQNFYFFFSKKRPTQKISAHVKGWNQMRFSRELGYAFRLGLKISFNFLIEKL